ncbi:8582_t:CDS:2, partial [Gigaspora margarita]
VALVQTVSISCSEGDHILAPENLPDSSPLLIYTASVVSNSYNLDNRGGRESFMMACHLYNSVTNNKNIDSKTYLSDDSQLSTASSAAKVAFQEEIDTYFNSIEEKYATLTSQLPQKRQKIDLRNSSFTKSTSDKTTFNFTKVIFQFYKSTTSIEQPPVSPTS